MPMLREFREPDAYEAGENLRVIRELMERSTKHSTFSGLSGVFAGMASILGCLATRALQNAGLATTKFHAGFLAIWSLVVAFAIGMDYLLKKRKAASVGKRIVSQLGKQMALASLPGLGMGALLTFLFLRHDLLSFIYPVWMLSYGVAVSAVGLFSQREVKLLGISFLMAGALTLLIPQAGLVLMAVTFGGFHIFYGLAIARKDGW